MPPRKDSLVSTIIRHLNKGTNPITLYRCMVDNGEATQGTFLLAYHQARMLWEMSLGERRFHIQ